MKKVIMGLIALLLFLAAWFFFFKDDGSMFVSFKRHSSALMRPSKANQKITAQALTDDAEEDGSEEVDGNFLKSSGKAAESVSVKLSIDYDNNGLLTTRDFYLRTVPGFDGSLETYPLFFAFHGTSPDGAAAALDLANKNADAGAVIIAPVGGKTLDGKNYSWNASGSTDQDDVAFVQKLWDLINGDSRIDLTTVGAWGGSVGSSFVSNKLSTGVTFLKVIGCFSSTLLDGADISKASSPLTVISAHGETDPLVPIDGGPTSFAPYSVQMSEEAATALWVNHNNEALKKTASDVNGSYVTWSYSCEFKENDSYKKWAYSWSNGSVVELWRLKNIGHASQGALITITGQSTAAFLLEIFKTLQN